MRASEILVEGLSPIVYYYRSLASSKTILTTGNFELAAAIGAERAYSPKGYYYFLSTTRTRHGGYHTNNIGNSGVLFVLDGNWYNSRYKSKPIDYYLDRNTLMTNKASEAEDRLHSKFPEISIGGVKEIHVYTNTNRELPGTMKSDARQILLLAKKRNIPVYFYTDPNAWLNFDKRNLGDISTLTGKAQHKDHNMYKSYVKPWIELIFAKNKNQLTNKDTSEIWHRLTFSSIHRLDDITRSLATDMSNARKPSNKPDRKHVKTILEFMRKNNLDTIPEFVKFLAKKWQRVYNTERDREREQGNISI